MAPGLYCAALAPVCKVALPTPCMPGKSPSLRSPCLFAVHAFRLSSPTLMISSVRKENSRPNWLRSILFSLVVWGEGGVCVRVCARIHMWAFVPYQVCEGQRASYRPESVLPLWHGTTQWSNLGSSGPADVGVPTYWAFLPEFCFWVFFFLYKTKNSDHHKRLMSWRAGFSTTPSTPGLRTTARQSHCS